MRTCTHWGLKMAYSSVKTAYRTFYVLNLDLAFSCAAGANNMRKSQKKVNILKTIKMRTVYAVGFEKTAYTTEKTRVKYALFCVTANTDMTSKYGRLAADFV